MSAKHGRCAKCRVIWRWTGRPLVRDALCHVCREPLARTAARLVRNIPIRHGQPLEVRR